MRRLAPLLLLELACAHRPTTDRPVLVTPELIGKLRVALPGGPVVDVDDGDCDDHDRSRINLSFEELREALVDRGFAVVEPNQANLIFEHRTHVTACTYDGQLEGTAQLIAKDRSGRTVEIVSLFPLWPEGLVDLILTSERLAAFANAPIVPMVKVVPPAPPPPAPPPPVAVTKPAAAFSIRPMDGGLDPALADQLVEYLILRLIERGTFIRDDASPDALTSKYLEVGDRCVLSASLYGRSATERGGCGTDELMDAIDRIATRLTEQPM